MAEEKNKTEEKKKPKITVKKYGVDLSPTCFVYHVLIEHEGIWEESFGSEENLRCFLRGFKAAFSMNNIFISDFEIEIPRHAEPLPPQKRTIFFP